MATSPAFTTETPRPDLRDTLMKFDLQANQAGFVGLTIAPVLEVAEAFGQYPVIEPGDLLKDAPVYRNEDGTYNFVGGRTGKDSWMTEEQGIGERVDRREAIMYRNWFDAEMLAAMRARNIVLQAHNNRVIAKVEALPAGQQTDVVTDNSRLPWDNPNADPVADIRDASLKLRDRIGMIEPLLLTLEYETWQYLKDNETVIDRIKYAGFRDPERTEITVDAMLSIFAVDAIKVSTAMKNTAPDGAGADGTAATPVTFEKAWNPNNALLSVTPTTRDMRTPQYMRTFHWGADGSQIGGVIESYGDVERRSDIVRVRMDTQEKEVYSQCAELLTGLKT